MSELELLGELNRAAGTTGLGFNAVCNALAGTTGLDGVGALNALAGTTGVELGGVLNRLAGTTGRGAQAAAGLIGVNLLTTNQSSVETNTTGLSAVNGTFARTTSVASIGSASLQVTSTVNGNMYGQTGEAANYITAATAGVTYTATVDVRSAVTSRDAAAYIQWIDSGNAVISSSPGTFSATATGSFGGRIVSATAPAGTVKARVLGYFQSVVIGEVHYMDKLGLWVGKRTTWVAP